MIQLSSKRTLAQTFAIFFDRRIVSVFILGILSGLPWLMIGSSLSLWLKEVGVSRTEIGYAGLIFTVFAINFLWSPLLDQIRPRLGVKLGQRRGWIILCQLVIVTACLVMSTLAADSQVKIIALVGLVIAIAAATQDIAIDAYRVDQFAPEDAPHISAAAAAATSGWWTGYAGLGFFPLMLSDMGWSWPSLYILMGMMSLFFCLFIFFSPDPPNNRQAVIPALYRENLALISLTSIGARLAILMLLLTPFAVVVWCLNGSPGMPAAISSHPLYIPAIAALEALLFMALLWRLRALRSGRQRALSTPRFAKVPAWLLTTIVAPFEDFFRRNGVRFALGLLLFIFIFKLGESFLGRMSIVFYKEVGFDNTEIAAYSKLLTWLVTMIAAVPCGILNAHFGLIKGLYVSGICMAASNLMFCLIAAVGADIPLYIATVIVDGLTAAWASIAFVSFISMLCNHTFSATQYALMASLSTLGRTTVASFSGQAVDALDGNWSIFFVITALMVIPSLLLLWRLSGRLRELYLSSSPDTASGRGP